MGTYSVTNEDGNYRLKYTSADPAFTIDSLRTEKDTLPDGALRYYKACTHHTGGDQLLLSGGPITEQQKRAIDNDLAALQATPLPWKESTASQTAPQTAQSIHNKHCPLTR